MSESEEGPRRAAGDDSAYEGLYRSATPRRIWVDDDSPTTYRAAGNETLWRADEHSAEPPTAAHLPQDPPAPSPTTPAAQSPGTRRRRFGSSLGYTILSALVPGLGLVGSRDRGTKIAGVAVALGFVALIGGFGLYFASQVNPAPGESWLRQAASVAAGMISGRATLHVLTVVLIAVGLLWVALIAGTQIATRPTRLGAGKRLVGALLVGVLSLGIAAPVAVGARYSQVLAASLGKTFVPQEQVTSKTQPQIDGGPNPFADIPRINILLLGADMDERRIEEAERLGYGLRTDTIILASIDTTTGETALIQIPRNVQYTPFPRGSEMRMLYPNGFTGAEPADNWFINTIWENVEANHPDVFREQTYPGAEGLKQGVQGITGLEVHYFVMLNIDALPTLVDALGGVTVNINERLPMGGSSNNPGATWGWLEAGPNQRLDGQEALWYARSRWSTSDYSRMARQSCLIGAIVDQSNPATLLTRFEAIAGASTDMIQTDIPAEALEPLVALALKSQEHDMERLVYTQGKNGYWFANPDFDEMRAAVDEMLDPSPAPSPSPSPSSAPADPEPSEASSERPPTFVDGSQTVTDACAYNPVE